MNDSLYTGFDESLGAQNFFKVYEDMFQKILVEEEKARVFSEEKEDHIESYLKAPNFGKSDLSLDKIKEVYTYWENFVSCKSFLWADVYKHEKDHNRYVRRLIDQENKRARKKAKRKYLDLIK